MRSPLPGLPPRGSAPSPGRSLTLAVLGAPPGTASVSERPEAKERHLAVVVLAALLPALLGAGPDALQIVNPVLSRSDDGVAEPAGSQNIGGDTLFFSCRVAHYARSPEQRVSLEYSVQAFDPKGVPLMEVFKGAIAEEVAPQDKDWLPKISTEIAIPPAVPTGAYKIAVNVEDAVAHTTASLDVPFQVRGRAVPATGTLTVQNMRYYRGEDDTRPLDKPVYKAGDTLWVRFDVTGFQYGPNNRVDLSYVFSVLDAAGTPLFTSPEPAVDQGESFYPRPYASGAFSIAVQSAVKPGTYAIGIKATDGVGNKTVTAKQPFTVE